MNRYFSLIIFSILLGCLSAQAQVTIGSNKKPVDGALLMLDDNSTGTSNENARKGIGLPRVELQNYSLLQMGKIHNIIQNLTEKNLNIQVC